MLVLLGDNSFLFDASLLTGKSAEIVQLSATNLTNLVHYDAIDRVNSGARVQIPPSPLSILTAAKNDEN